MRKLAVALILVISLTGCGELLSIGDEAYNISIQNHQGEQVTLEDFSGKTIFLLAWSTT